MRVHKRHLPGAIRHYRLGPGRPVQQPGENACGKTPGLFFGYAVGTTAVVSFCRSSQPSATCRVRMKIRVPAGGTPYLAT